MKRRLEQRRIARRRRAHRVARIVQHAIGHRAVSDVKLLAEDIMLCCLRHLKTPQGSSSEVPSPKVPEFQVEDKKHSVDVFNLELWNLELWNSPPTPRN